MIMLAMVCRGSALCMRRLRSSQRRREVQIHKHCRKLRRSVDMGVSKNQGPNSRALSSRHPQKGPPIYGNSHIAEVDSQKCSRLPESRLKLRSDLLGFGVVAQTSLQSDPSGASCSRCRGTSRR